MADEQATEQVKRPQRNGLPKNPKVRSGKRKALPDSSERASDLGKWWRGQDLNLRPSGYEPDELPDCSTPRRTNDDSSGLWALKPGPRTG